MAYDERDDELARQLEQQMATQPVGGGLKLDDAGGIGVTGMPSGGNTGVSGGVDLGGVAQEGSNTGTKMSEQPTNDRAAAASKARSEGYTDIEGAGGLATGNYMGSLEGFNTGGWGSGERGSNTHKNTFGKIASRYDPTQAGSVRALMNDPDFRAYFPDAKLVQHQNEDLIDFGDGNPVDVLRGATAGGAGQAWQWGVNATQGGDGGGGGAAGGGDPTALIQSQLDSILSGGDGGDSTQLQQILEELLAQQQV